MVRLWLVIPTNTLSFLELGMQILDFHVHVIFLKIVDVLALIAPILVMLLRRSHFLNNQSSETVQR